ncbi:MAG: sensor histidine kinase [Lachnospiraceae bacterium]|nr:sensor histidine kinase [Lachnospiraceae bacterium]
MTQTLQKKFIRTAMIAITLLMAFFLAAVNIFNMASSNTSAESTLGMIMQEEAFSRPAFSTDDENVSAPPAPDASAASEVAEDAGLSPVAPENASNPGPEAPENAGGSGTTPPPMSPEAQDALASQRYFFVRTSASGKVIYTDLTHISSVDETTAESYVEEIASDGKTEGRLHGYFYKVEEKEVNGGHIYAFLDERRVISANLRILLITVVVGVIVWGLMLALVIFLSKKAIRPVAESIDKQKRFISDAGHEFKTPLAIIRANAEVLELHSGENKWLTNIRGQVDRLTMLTTNLLTLTKMEEGPDIIPPETFDAAALLLHTLRGYDASFELKNMKIEAAGALVGSATRDGSNGPLAGGTAGTVPVVVFNFRRDWYVQLLTILFDNTVKYAKEETTYKISLECLDGKSDATNWSGRVVASDCPAIRLVFDNVSASPLKGDPDRLFDRFYRADEARTQKSGGSGIGLSVARAITDHAASSITCRYLPDNHIVFEVMLRAMKAAKEKVW